MTETNGGNSDGSRWKLVKWLVIIGIGIPVLVELLTLFNLVSVQIFDREKSSAQREEARATVTPDGVPVLSEGDRLTPAGSRPVLTLREKMVHVGPERWEFTLGFGLDSLDSAAVPFRFEVDSLRLRGGEVLEGKGPFRLPGGGDEGIEVREFRWQWSFPPGELPQRLFVRMEWNSETDTARVVRRELSLGNIPTRYRVDG